MLCDPLGFRGPGSVNIPVSRPTFVYFPFFFFHSLTPAVLAQLSGERFLCLYLVAGVGPREELGPRAGWGGEGELARAFQPAPLLPLPACGDL